MPLYPLYALLFADSGLDEAQISALLALWSATGVVAEVPSGALADRFGRRWALVGAGVLQALGYALWTALPGLPAFAAGFVLWGLGGALVSGAFEALLYDGLAAAGSRDRFPQLLGRVNAVRFASELPTAGAATLLFAVGGFPLVGWASVGLCLAGSVLAARIPEPGRGGTADSSDGDADSEAGWLDTLRTGLGEVRRTPTVRGAVLAVAVVGGLDGVEEYFPLLAGGWGVTTTAVPVAVLGISLAGVAGSLLAGSAARLRGGHLGGLLAAAAAGFAVAAAAGQVAGLVAVAAAYGVLQVVLLVTESRLQDNITGPARATATSVAGLATELVALALFAGWALGGLPLVAVGVLAVAAGLPWLLPRADGADEGRR